VDPLGDARTLAALFLTYSTQRPDFIFNFTSKATAYSSLAAAGSGARVVNNISGLGRAFDSGGNPLLRRVALGMNRIAGAVAWHTFYQNPSDMAFGLANGFCPRDRSSLLPGSGVDLARFRPAIRSPSRPFNFLYVGRLMREKGTFDFLQVAEAMAPRAEAGEVSFTLAGPDWSLSTGEREELKARLARAPVRFLGMVEDVERLYAEAHCVVLPSRYPEGIPRVLLEAAASGKISVCYPNPGSEQVVRDGETGFVVTEGTQEALRRTLEKVLHLPEEVYLRMVREGIRLARRNFDEREVIKAYLDLLP
jgi:glycosyltransferase involved in cell wall biosynthesis